MELAIRALSESELPAADRIFRLAFGTFLGLPDPLRFAGDTDYVGTRWRTDPESTFAAIDGDDLLGSNFATRWGSFGFFGPLSVRPDLWERGVAKRLLAATMDRFEAWHLAHAGLFTFPHSAKHVGLYHHFGFYPRFLTAVMAKPVSAGAPAPPEQRLSAHPSPARPGIMADCGAITDAILDGLDVAIDIRAVETQSLGDTLLLTNDGRLRGFAVCHVGAGTEAGSGACYVKFAAVTPAPRAGADFDRLLDLCERFAAERGATQLLAGVNTAREGAYSALLARGFRTMLQGVAMQRPNAAGYNRPDVFALDDWR
jgi:GNAT superfamily N-acetyltransferase